MHPWLEKLNRHFPLRYSAWFLCAVGLLVSLSLSLTMRMPGGWDWVLPSIFAALVLLGVRDMRQGTHSVLRNYPVIGHLRYLFEFIRPEIRQYFIEGDNEAAPFSRQQRSLVYQRAKGAPDKRPFGTQKDVSAQGYEWINHSMHPTHLPTHDFRIVIGGASQAPAGDPAHSQAGRATPCTQPYAASVFNISAMSFGALSANAILALNAGAKRGGFAHDTGEGSISRHHRGTDPEGGGDLIWEIGSGYFGCRHPDGRFNPELFAANARLAQVKMIEIKLSQGAKPGHGGVLPGPKVTPEIAEARGVPPWVDCVSPASHSAFSTPIEMMQFIDHLRALSGGKPVGFKLCIGHPWEWFAIAKAIRESGSGPDFITVDGAEGGTGAAPVEFADHKGAPLREGLMLVHNTLVGLGIRDRVRIVASGKLISAFDMCRVFALGADSCNIARGFMFAIGCIQAQTCHTGKCPTGVATQDPGRYRALVVDDKYRRVANFHRNTLHALKEAVESSGLVHPSQFTPHHLMIRVNSREVRSAASQYLWLEPGELAGGQAVHPAFQKYWDGARPDTFAMAH